MVLTDAEIRYYVETYEMISPFRDYPEQDKTPMGISGGLTSTGYDLRLGNTFKMLRTDAYGTIDPLNHNEALWQAVTADEVFILPPHGFVLAQSIEHLKMPSDISANAVGKSTYARSGVDCMVTPIEPGWEGIVTIELSNETHLPAKLYVGMGILQLRFELSKYFPERTYADKKGKYQNQSGLTHAK